MKRFLISAGILTTVLPSTANAKGCIKVPLSVAWLGIWLDTGRSAQLLVA